MFLVDPENLEGFIEGWMILKNERWILPYLQAEFEEIYTDKNTVFYFKFTYRSKEYWKYVVY